MPIRKRGKWWHYRFTVGGQEYAGSTELQATEKNQKAAERFENQKRQDVLSGREIKANRYDFATAAGEFVAWCRDVEYRAKPNTADRIKTSFASLVDFFGTTLIRDLSPGDLERYKSHRIQVNKVRGITLRHDLHALSLFFQYCERMGWRKGNPVREVGIPSDADAVRMHALSIEEETAYFKSAKEITDRSGRRNLFDVAKVILNQGCRPEEIMSARKIDLDVKAGTWQIPGGKSRAARRKLYLTPESLEILGARMAAEGTWLFPSDRYESRHITKLSTSHDRACRNAGVSFVLYDLRHTFGSRQATQAKTDPFTLAAIMGHSNLRTIMRYVHPDQADQREAMERYASVLRRGRLKRVK